MSGMGFTGDIGLEAAAFGQALLTGAALGVYFDFYRILRRVFRFGYAMIFAQDVLFWLSGAVGVFFASAVVSGGQLRIFFVLAVFVGWGIYAATVGSLIMSIIDMVLLVVRRIAAGVNERILRPSLTRVKTVSKRISVPVREKFPRIIKKMREK